MNRPDSARSDEGVATFTTPTVMHFAGALLVSALLIAPWHSLVTVATLLGFAGFYGVLHMLRVVFRARRLNTYNPDLEDWISYTILPTLAYGAICAGAIRLPTAPVQALFAIGGGVVLLLFIGIRNAWDLVTFLVVRSAQAAPTARPRDETP